MSLLEDQLRWRAHELRSKSPLAARALIAKNHIRPLNIRISEAIAWGCPDRESIGMSHGELTKLLAEALCRIEELERHV